VSAASPSLRARDLRRVAVDQVGVEERSRHFQTRSLKGPTKLAGLRLAVSMMDLTTLEGADTPGKVAQLCRKALQPMDARFDCPSVAAVCVYPSLVRAAKGFLAGTAVRVASVATGFPSGQYPLKIRLDDTRRAVGDGADEIDMVIHRGAFLAGEFDRVFDEIAAVRDVCAEAHLKVILETGELQTYENVRLASDLAMHAGAHFIKTSTGKVSPAATLPVTLVMLEAIRDFNDATGRMVGMKPAGGLRTSKEALHYLVAVKETLGDAWLSPDWFRFGASSLLTDVTLQIAKAHDGAYQSGDYFSLA
jgi:deoxyribose-phosphate aldolase